MKTSNILILGAAVAAILIARKKTVGTGAMSDMPVTLDNIKMGVSRGWYTAELTMVKDRRLFVYPESRRTEAIRQTFIRWMKQPGRH